MTRILRFSSGFTLVELMVTIAVMAVITMIAAPSFTQVIAKQQLNLSTRELMSVLTEARSQAILKRTSTTVTLNSTTENSGTQYYWSPKSDNTLTSPSTLTAVVFNEYGSLTQPASDTSFVICNSKSNTTKTFSLNVMGTVYATPANDGTC